MWQNSRLISYTIATCAKPREAMVGGFGQAQLFLRHYVVKKQVFEQHVTKAARHTSPKTQLFMPLISHDTNHISTRKHEYMATPALSCPRITPPLVTKRPDERRALVDPLYPQLPRLRHTLPGEYHDNFIPNFFLNLCTLSISLSTKRGRTPDRLLVQLGSEHA